MDILKEFLESSTIHGLVYISTSKGKFLKTLWLVIVVIAFATALNLVHNSYADWDKDPVSTTVSTHPINQLPFPNVTICPPKEYNTALNYDLMKTSKIILSQEDREELIMESKKAFLIDSYNQFVDLMKALSNPGNMQAMYDGLQTIPHPYKKDGFEITSRGKSGSITTPWFGERSNGNFDILYYCLSSRQGLQYALTVMFYMNVMQIF